MNDINITMTAFHGKDKPLLLKELIQTLLGKFESLVGTELPDVFTPYTMYQIHATVIGMETDYINSQLYGHWFYKNRQNKRNLVDIKLLSELLKNSFNRAFPCIIRFGGFKKAYCTCPDQGFQEWECVTGMGEFHSCGRSAYEGSFYGYAPGPVVFTGWPVSAGTGTDEFPHTLYLFRRSFEKAGFLDKYHSDEHPFWKNDDCHVKLGNFLKPFKKLPEIIEEMRQFIREKGAMKIEIQPSDMAIILYRDTSLLKNAVIEKLPLLSAIQEPEKLVRLFERMRMLRKETNG